MVATRRSERENKEEEEEMKLLYDSDYDGNDPSHASSPPGEMSQLPSPPTMDDSKSPLPPQGINDLQSDMETLQVDEKQHQRVVTHAELMDMFHQQAAMFHEVVSKAVKANEERNLYVDTSLKTIRTSSSGYCYTSKAPYRYGY